MAPVDHDLAAVADLLRETGSKPLPFVPAFLPLEAGDSSRLAVAVDGSHAVLFDAGSTWVVAWRSVAVYWPGPPTLTPEPAILAVSPQDAAGELEARWIAAGLDPEAVPRIRTADRLAESLCALAEFEAALHALSAMPEDGILLWDGALEQLGSASARAVSNRLLEVARNKGVAVVGCAKRSRLHRDGVGLVHALQRHARQEGKSGCWQVPVPDYHLAHVALLHPRAPTAFRIDTTNSECIAKLLPWCRDAVYLGYPYPLAVAHNAVALTGDQVRMWQERVLAEVRIRGGPEAALLLADWHEVLDRNVPK